MEPALVSEKAWPASAGRKGAPTRQPGSSRQDPQPQKHACRPSRARQPADVLRSCRPTFFGPAGRHARIERIVGQLFLRWPGVREERNAVARNGQRTQPHYTALGVRSELSAHTYWSVDTMLTKSLHTITAATNVARYMYALPHARSDWTAEDLASRALNVLGYPGLVNNATVGNGADPTVARIVAACAKLLLAHSVALCDAQDTERRNAKVAA